MRQSLSAKQLGDSQARLLKEREELLNLKKESVHTEEGSDAESPETNITLQKNIMESVECIDSALDRVDRGVYGVCTDCGKDIPYERLMAFPAAARCLSCKEKYQEQP